MALARANESVPTQAPNPAETILRIVETDPEEDAAVLLTRILEANGITRQQLLDFLKREHSGQVIQGIINYLKGSQNPDTTPNTTGEISFPDLMTSFDSFLRKLTSEVILEIPGIRNSLADGVDGSIAQIFNSPKLKTYAIIVFLILVATFGIIVTIDGLGRLDPSSSHSMTPIYSLFD